MFPPDETDTPSRPRWVLGAAIFTAVAALAGCGLLVVVLAAGEGSATRDSSDTAMDAESLIREFAGNAPAARKRLTGKRLSVRGEVGTVMGVPDGSGSILVMLQPGLTCIFPESRARQTERLRPGNRVAVRGTVTVSGVVLEDCELLR